jgi:DNA ligase-1
VIGDNLPLEVKLNIVLQVAFNSTQPATRHASGLALRFLRIKAVQRNKNVDFVDTLQYARSLAECDAQIHRPILTRRVNSSDLLRRG